MRAAPSGDGHLACLRLRAAAAAAVRRVFAARGYLEVETPVRVSPPALEDHIDAIPADARHHLRTSPEFALKRLVAAGATRVMELGPCFRAGERGARHLPEFTLLEWLRADADYLDLIVEMESLLVTVAADPAVQAVQAERPPVRVPVDWTPPWRRLTVREAFRAHAGWDPFSDWDADRFDLDLVTRVEPALAGPRPVILIDYPPPAAALARLRPGPPPVAERWELYAGGLELANAYGELTDAVEQRRRFEACAAGRRARGQAVYPLDEAFLAALARGLPPCAGVALGFDRLVMLLAGADRIEAVRACVPE